MPSIFLAKKAKHKKSLFLFQTFTFCLFPFIFHFSLLFFCCNFRTSAVTGWWGFRLFEAPFFGLHLTCLNFFFFKRVRVLSRCSVSSIRRKMASAFVFIFLMGKKLTDKMIFVFLKDF